MQFQRHPIALLRVTFLSAVTPLLAQGQEVIRPPADEGMIRGTVFADHNENGRHDSGEPGIDGVLVSNGLEVVVTDSNGRYVLAVRGDMDLTVVQPSGWRVPVDERQVPQFAYTHKPGGTPESLHFGGLPDTGPAPAFVNFPLYRVAESADTFRCAVLGDTQTYSNHEVSQFRDSAMTDLVNQRWQENDCMLYVGDVVGDDLGLLERILEIGSAAVVPQWLVHGNHDFDFDASDDAHSADSWRRLYGPNYYAFEIGEVSFIVLDNIVYPCGPEEAQLEGREFCQERTTYNARVTATQMQWLDNLLDRIPEDRLIVLAHHAPLVSFVDSTSAQHQTDNAVALYRLLEGRSVVSLSGHTHTLENLAPGEYFGGWQEAVGVTELPFRHIIAGAVSGNWWQGDFSVDGDAHALQRLGAPKGVLTMSFDGTSYRESYAGSRIDPQRAQWLSLNTPDFRHWFETIVMWWKQPRDSRDPVPPLSINDLSDTGIITSQDLDAGVYFTVNVWAGSRETRVVARIDDRPAVSLERTQSGSGEAPRVGALYADSFAARRQLSVSRYALQSRSGKPRNQGAEAFRSQLIQGPPQPQGSVADRNMHLWRMPLPTDLSLGVHRIQVTSTDRHGREHVETLLFEVRDQQPPARARQDIW